MDIVVLFLGIMITIPIVQVLAILINVRKVTYIQHSNTYSLINYAPEYDSRKTMIQYRKFLSSELMKDIEKRILI